MGEDVRELVNVLKDVRDKLIGLYALSSAMIYLGFGTIVGLNIMLDLLIYSRIAPPLNEILIGVFWGIATVSLMVLNVKIFGKPISKYKEVLRGKHGRKKKSRLKGSAGILLISLMWIASFLTGAIVGWYLSKVGIIGEYYSAQFGLLLALALGNTIMATLTRERKPLACGISLGASIALLPLTGSFDNAWTYTSSAIIVIYNLTGLAYMIDATRLVAGRRITR